MWAAIDALREDPQLGKALKRELDGLWRIPVARIRIVYRFDSRTLEVVRIGPRETIYEDLVARRAQGSGPRSTPE